MSPPNQRMNKQRDEEVRTPSSCQKKDQRCNGEVRTSSLRRKLINNTTGRLKPPRRVENGSKSRGRSEPPRRVKNFNQQHKKEDMASLVCCWLRF